MAGASGLRPAEAGRPAAVFRSVARRPTRSADRPGRRCTSQASDQARRCGCRARARPRRRRPPASRTRRREHRVAQRSPPDAGLPDSIRDGRSRRRGRGSPGGRRRSLGRPRRGARAHRRETPAALIFQSKISPRARARSSCFARLKAARASGSMQRSSWGSARRSRTAPAKRVLTEGWDQSWAVGALDLAGSRRPLRSGSIIGFRLLKSPIPPRIAIARRARTRRRLSSGLLPLFSLASPLRRAHARPMRWRRWWGSWSFSAPRSDEAGSPHHG